MKLVAKIGRITVLLFCISFLQGAKAQDSIPSYHGEYCKPIRIPHPKIFISKQVENYYRLLLSYGFLTDENYICEQLNQNTNFTIILIKSSQMGIIIFSEKLVGLYAGSLKNIKNSIELLQMAKQISQYYNAVYKTQLHKYIIRTDRSLPGGLYIRNKNPESLNLELAKLDKDFIPISIYNYWYRERWLTPQYTDTINSISGAVYALLIHIYIADFHLADALELLQIFQTDSRNKLFYNENYYKCMYYLVYKFKYDIYSLPREFVFTAGQNNGTSFIFQVLKSINEISDNIYSLESTLFLEQILNITKSMVDEKELRNSAWGKIAMLIPNLTESNLKKSESADYDINNIKKQLLSDEQGRIRFGAVYWHWPDTRTISTGYRKHSSGHFLSIQKRNNHITQSINKILVHKISNSKNKSIYYTQATYPTHPDYYSYTPTGMYDLFVPQPLPMNPIELQLDSTIEQGMNFFIRMRTDIHVFPKTNFGNWLYSNTHIAWPGIKGYTVLYIDIFDTSKKKWILTHKRIIESIRKDLILTNWYALMYDWLP